MNPIISGCTSSSLSSSSVSSNSSSSQEPICLLEFQSGAFQGRLLYDQIKQVQAYLKINQKDQSPAQFISPFSNLYFTTKEQINAFKSNLENNYHFQVSKLEEGGFKVYLHSKVKGESLTEQQTKDLEEAELLAEEGKAFYDQDKLLQARDKYQASLKIFEQLDPEGISLGNMCHELAIVYEDLEDFLTAEDYFQRSIKVLQKHAYVDIAPVYNNLGSLYLEEEKFKEALINFQKSLATYGNSPPNTAEVANLYNNIGGVHSTKGEFDNALESFEKSRTIFKQLETKSLDVAILCDNIGGIYWDRGALDPAKECFQESLAIFKEKEPEGLNEAHAHSNIGCVYESQKNLGKAMEEHQTSLAIFKKLKPGSLLEAAAHNNIGCVYTGLSQYEKALEEHKKSLEMRQKIADKSLDVANSYNNIGKVYEAQGYSAKALNYFFLAYSIREEKLIPKHPDLLFVGNKLAQIALEVNWPEKALHYANEVINKDPTYKYAYNTKGLILQKEGKLNEALAAFDLALNCDQNYDESTIRRLKVKAEIANTVNDVVVLQEEVDRARHLPLTEYDEQTKFSQGQIARANWQKPAVGLPFVELPLSKYKSGSEEYYQQLNKILELVFVQNQELFAQNQELSVQNRELTAKVNEHELRLDGLDRRFLSIEYALEILQNESKKLDQKIEEKTKLLPQNDPELLNLLAERHRRTALEAQLIAFNVNPDVHHYFCALLSELEAAYMAAQVIESEKVSVKKSDKWQKASGYFSGLIKLIPYVGEAVSTLVSGVAYIADLRSNIKNENDFKRMRCLAPTVQEFDEIALRFAVLCTLSNMPQLERLQGEVTANDWKTKLMSFKGGLEGFVSTFIKDNETKAKVLGRLDAFKVITHLQGENVAENYAMKGVPPQLQSRRSFIAKHIFDSIKVASVA